MKARTLLATAAASGMVLTPLGWLPAPAAHAAGAGEISVQVRDLYTGNSVSGVQVTLYDTANGSAVASRVGWGYVVFEGLDAGTYTAKAHDPSGAYRDRFSVAEVVTADHPQQSASIAMTPVTPSFGKVRGTVSQLTAGDLDGYVEVYASSVTTAALQNGTAHPVARGYIGGYDGGPGGPGYPGGPSGSGDPVLVSDTWQANVGPGSYKLRAVDADSRSCSYDADTHESTCTYGRSAWLGGSTAERASVVSVARARATTAADITLPAETASATGPARIAGTVTGAGGSGLDDVEVDLLQQVDGRWYEVASTETGDDGTFGFSQARRCEYQEPYEYEGETYGGYMDCHNGYAPVPPGTFTLRFSDDVGDDYDDYYGYYGYYGYGDGDDRDAEYATVYYGNVAPDDGDTSRVPAGAQTITLAETGSQQADAAMTQLPFDVTSGLHGVLTDDTGRPYRGEVYVVDLQGNQVEALYARRDGSWTAPVTRLAPGQYKLFADADEVVSGWVGGKSFTAARTFTVPVTGSADAGRASLARWGRVSGRIGVTGVSGVDTHDLGVTLWNTQGRPVAVQEAAADGRFTATLRPGTYLVSADGVSYSSFDESDVGVSRRPLIERFWRAAWTAAKATAITVGSGGSVVGVDIGLSNQLVAASAPQVNGRARVGQTLRATPGAWNETDDVTYSYVWKRGSRVVSRRASYRVTAADRGKALVLTVVATDTTLTYRSGSARATVRVPRR